MIRKQNIIDKKIIPSFFSVLLWIPMGSYGFVCDAVVSSEVTPEHPQAQKLPTNPLVLALERWEGAAGARIDSRTHHRVRPTNTENEK